MIRVSSIDHVAVTVSDPNRSIAFYRDVLGMTVANEWPGTVTALQAGDTFLAISWREKGKASVEGPPISIHHFAFRVNRESFKTAQALLPAKGFEVKFENNGTNDSLYFRDPDGHLLELACYESEFEAKGSTPRF